MVYERNIGEITAGNLLQFAREAMAMVDDLPFLKVVIFHFKLLNYQRIYSLIVNLPRPIQNLGLLDCCWICCRLPGCCQAGAKLLLNCCYLVVAMGCGQTAKLLLDCCYIPLTLLPGCCHGLPNFFLTSAKLLIDCCGTADCCRTPAPLLLGCFKTAAGLMLDCC